MTRPNLQVALDHSDLPSAIKAIKTVGDIVDIIEVGTILILQAGDQAVRCIRAMYPDKTIVAEDRKSTRLNSSPPKDLVCRLLLDKKKKKEENKRRKKRGMEMGTTAETRE